MSARDAEQHGVDDDERHLFVRLDDAKANLGLISGRARWFRRVGVTIANGDEVGVLVPDQLEQVETSPQFDGSTAIIACLLAQVPEAEITLNAAAKLLAWSDDERFWKYRETDGKGTNRATKPCRRGSRCLPGGHQHRRRRHRAGLHLRSGAAPAHLDAVRGPGCKHRSCHPRARICRRIC